MDKSAVDLWRRLALEAETRKSSAAESVMPPRALARGGSRPLIEYTCTRVVDVAPDVLERHRLAVVGNDAVADGLRQLRTQLLMQMRKNGWQTIAVTSPNKGAGKTTISLNLAISLGMEVDHTALLVDADLRDPDLRRMLGLAEGPGLAEYLAGAARLEDLLIHPRLGNLVILPGGAPVDNASELLGSPMMADMVGELRSRYSNRLILFDVPPILSGAETLALSSHLDATILLVEDLKTTSDDIQRSCELLRHCNLLGVVLNKSRGLPRREPNTRR